MEQASVSSNHVVIITGLPASGKLIKARQIAAKFPHYVVLSYPGQFDFQYKQLVYLLTAGKCVILADMLLSQEQRQTAELVIKRHNPKAAITWLFFENNPVQCAMNLDSLPSTRPETTKENIFTASQYYDIPSNAVILPVHRPSICGDPVSGGEVVQ